MEKIVRLKWQGKHRKKINIWKYKSLEFSKPMRFLNPQIFKLKNLSELNRIKIKWNTS